MTVTDAFPDIEDSLIQLIVGNGLGDASDVTPADWAGRLPFHRVTVYGGADDQITDLSRVDVDSFGATKAEARDAAESVRQLFTRRGAHVIGTAVIDRITTDTKPHEVPWTGQTSTASGPYRYTAAYSASARR